MAASEGGFTESGRAGASAGGGGAPPGTGGAAPVAKVAASSATIPQPIRKSFTSGP